MKKLQRTAAIVGMLLGALTAHAANDNGKNGNRYGQIKKEQKQAVSVPEPATFALFGTALAALGLRAFMRRRKSDD